MIEAHRSSEQPSWPRIATQVIARDRIDVVRVIIEGELRAVHQDYFDGLDFASFLARHIYPDSRWLLLVQHRSVVRGIAPLLVNDALVEIARSHFKGPPKYLNLLFVRAAFPRGGSRGPKRLDNYTYGPLHRDNYVELPTLTFWIPLNDIDASTGGLVWTTDEGIARVIGEGTSPATFHKEGAIPAGFVELLKSRTTQAVCQAGDAVYFDRTLLHGSNYAVEKPRLTVDLRFVDSGAVTVRRAGAQILELDELEEAAARSFIDLLHLGDVKFARRFPVLRRRYFRHRLYPLVRPMIAMASVVYLGGRRRMRGMLGLGQ